MSDASDYGKYYWCVKVTKDMSANGEIYVFADEPVVGGNGELAFVRNAHADKPRLPPLVLAAGKWTALYGASVLDGHAVAVEHWKGEVER